MSRFQFLPTPIAGVVVVQRQTIADHRGFLARHYCADAFAQAGHPLAIAQINNTLTRQQGTVRGMHFQLPPHGETKLVACLHGEVFDVAVDLRRNSPTFLCWHAEKLSADNGHALLIPAGCAHGFQALVDGCELLYLHSAPYLADVEGGLDALDPRLRIDWPLVISQRSERDQRHAWLSTDFEGFDV